MSSIIVRRPSSTWWCISCWSRWRSCSAWRWLSCSVGDRNLALRGVDFVQGLMELQPVSSTFRSNVWFFSMCSTSILMRLISRTTRGKSSSRMTSFGEYQKCSTSRNIRFNFRAICLNSVHFCVIWRLVNLTCCMYVRLVPGPEVLTDIRIRTASKVVEFYKQDGEIFENTWSSSPPPLSSDDRFERLVCSRFASSIYQFISSY